MHLLYLAAFKTPFKEIKKKQSTFCKREKKEKINQIKKFRHRSWLCILQLFVFLHLSTCRLSI